MHEYKYKVLLAFLNIFLLPEHFTMAPPAAIDIEGVRDTEGIAIPDPLTVNGVSARRAKAGKLIAGTAAYTSSDYFKSPVCRSSPSGSEVSY
jgi:hypothetical protein